MWQWAEKLEKKTTTTTTATATATPTPTPTSDNKDAINNNLTELQ